jgi:hypothetical protein
MACVVVLSQRAAGVEPAGLGMISVHGVPRLPALGSWWTLRLGTRAVGDRADRAIRTS